MSGHTAGLVAIVDDDDAILSALARLIRTIGYRPRTFASAEAFLGEVADVQPACVLTDIQMPGLNGLDLVKDLRQRGYEMPILVMTAYPSLAKREERRFGGVVSFMTKPLDDGALERWLLAAVGEPPDC